MTLQEKIRVGAVVESVSSRPPQSESEEYPEWQN